MIIKQETPTIVGTTAYPTASSLTSTGMSVTELLTNTDGSTDEAIDGSTDETTVDLKEGYAEGSTVRILVGLIEG